MAKLPNARDSRKAAHPIEPIFVNRWSPRAMTGEAVSDDDLMRLFEAARWAPSGANTQPWEFVVTRDRDKMKRCRQLLRGQQLGLRAKLVLELLVARLSRLTPRPRRPASAAGGGATKRR